MITKFVGMKELRQNMAKLSKEAQQKGQRLIVLRKNTPAFELRPLKDSDALIETLRRDIEEAESDIRAGRTYSQKEVAKLFGL